MDATSAVETRICSRCNQPKAATEENFHLRKCGRFNGLWSGWCIPCHREYSRQQRINKPPKPKAIVITIPFNRNRIAAPSERSQVVARVTDAGGWTVAKLAPAVAEGAFDVYSSNPILV